MFRSVMKHRFSDVPQVEVPRSTFDRSHAYKTTFDAGYLVPVFHDYAVPGDTMKLNMAGFGRLSTPASPIMDNIFLETFFFAVPIRLVWENWVRFCGERKSPADSISYSIPQTTVNNVANMTLYDYFGIPTQIAANLTINNLFPRAYNLIYNEWFKDQNLQDAVVVDIDDGPDTATDYVLLRRNKRHDYFTSALPWLQKGDSVTISLGSSAPVIPDATPGYPSFNVGTGNGLYMSSTGGTQNIWTGTPSAGNAYWNDPALMADLDSAAAGTVNQLRQSIQIQKLLEKDARSGTRYIEIIKSHFGVTSDDARLQRPEYLGGGSTPVNISAIARTDSSPGSLGAVGTAAFRNHGFVKSFTEHCLVIGLANIRADITYQEGLERHWDYRTRYDMYWPVLAHLGEQSILNREIYLDAAVLGAGTDDDVFGYQERWAEMRYKPSKVTGKFRSNDANTLDVWHLSTEFGALPTLDDSFIQDDPPIDRVIVTPTEPHIIFDSWFTFHHTRPMPTFSIPGYNVNF